MSAVKNVTFIHADGASYLSVEADFSKKVLKVGCLGMGTKWGVSDHTWDYPIDAVICARILAIVENSELRKWDECYFGAYEPDLEWEYFMDIEGEERVRSFGQGMKAENLDKTLGLMKELVLDLSKNIYIDFNELEALYFCHVANGINCTTTLYRDMESKFEKTKVGEKTLTLSSEQWGQVLSLVRDYPLPKFGFRKEEGTQFVSRALYLEGKMVSYTYGGKVGPEWDAFEASLITAIGL